MDIGLIIAICVLGAAAYIDSKEQIVPNWLSLGGMALGIAISCLLPSIHNASTWYYGGLWAAGDCIGVVCFMCWYALVTERLLKYETLGGGDIKIMGAVATLVNFKVTICVMLLSPIFGMVSYAVERLRYEIYTMPYCPAMFAGLLFSALLWKPIIGAIG